MHRDKDASGISGTGTVAEGVLLSNGKVCLSWLSEYTSVGIYDDISLIMHIHGHGGSTRIVFVDDEPAETKKPSQQPTRMFPKAGEGFFLDKIMDLIEKAGSSEDERAKVLATIEGGKSAGLFSEEAYQQLLSKLGQSAP